MVGSGPFKFVASEFQPGNKVVYVKNTDYVPRSEPPNWASGGKIVKVDRVEWLVVPDHATAAAALSNGEVDWWENPPLDLVPTFAGQDVVVADADPLGSPQTLRFNHLWPPFRQCENASSGAGGRQPSRFHDHDRRRSEKLAARTDFLYRGNADGEQRRFGSADRQTRFRQGQKADRRSRVQGRQDRRARRDRSGRPAFAGARRRRSDEKARAQCRDRGDGLGSAGDAARLDEADRRRADGMSLAPAGSAPICSTRP